jgi:hypothetical protein
VDPEQLSSFQKGRTTFAEVVDKIGAPTSQTVNSEGDRTAFWTYVSAKARPESFIPIVGPLVGGADTKTSNVMMRFDSREVLQEYSASTGAMGSGTGFASGSNMSRIPNQPREAPAN